jgi:hypothetical protein
MKIFIYPQENGSVAVSSVIDDEIDCFKEISPNGIYMTDMELENFDNYFFQAVELKDGKLDINIKKAQEITRGRIRIEREKLLEKLDILYQRALESGKDLRDIEEEKQRLRDLPNAINNITDLKELKDFPVKTELEFKNLKHIGLSPEQYILHLQRENEQLHLNVNKLELEMATVLKALKKKYIL